MRRLLVPLAGLLLVTAVPRARADDGGLLLQAEDDQRTLDCSGRDVRIEGNRNHYILRGGCRSLTLRGDGDNIQAQMMPGGHIDVEGNGVLVTWSLHGSGPTVTVSVSGQGSRAMTLDAPSPAAPAIAASKPETPAAAPPAANQPPADKPATEAAAAPPQKLPPAPPLTGPVIELTISGEARDLNCSGKSVRIIADSGVYALRGGCRAVVVRGTGNLVQAEIGPGARINAAGADTKCAVVPAGTGAAPEIRATDGASAWQIPALGSYQPDPAAKP